MVAVLVDGWLVGWLVVVALLAVSLRVVVVVVAVSFLCRFVALLLCCGDALFACLFARLVGWLLSRFLWLPLLLWSSSCVSLPLVL